MSFVSGQTKKDLNLFPYPLLWGWKLELVKLIKIYLVPKKDILIFSINSEVNASELLENVDELFPCY